MKLTGLASDLALYFNHLQLTRFLYLGILFFTACSIDFSPERSTINPDRQKVNVVRGKSEIVDGAVSNIDLNVNISVSVGPSKNNKAYVSAMILQLDPNVNHDEYKNKVIESLIFKGDSVIFDKHTSSVPLCDNQLLNISILESQHFNKSLKVNLSTHNRSLPPYCLASLHFELPNHFNVNIRKNGILYYKGLLSYNELLAQLPLLMGSDKVRLITGYLRSVESFHKFIELERLLKKVQNSRTKKLLLTKAVPSEVSVTTDNFYKLLASFEASVDPNYKDSLIHLLKNSTGNIEFSKIEELIHNLNGYQQIDVLNVLLTPQLKIKFNQTFSNTLSLFKAFKFEIKRFEALKRTLKFVNYSHFSSSQIKQIIELFQTPRIKKSVSELITYTP